MADSLVDVLAPWGSDISFDDYFDAALVEDTQFSADASAQQLGVLLQQAAADTDPVTGVTSMPDDIFNPAIGIGIRKYVDLIDPDTVALEITRDALAGLPAIPSIAPSPAPTVTVTSESPFVFDMSFQTVDGTSGVLPDNTP